MKFSRNGIKELRGFIKKSIILNKNMFYLAILLFIIPTVLGYFFAPSLKSTIEPVIGTLKKQIVTGKITLTYFSIFSNNFNVVFRMYWSGIFAGILPAILLIFNGIIIGYFLARQSFLPTLLFIIPHGIFEIPGLIFGGASGFTLFKFIYYLIKDIMNPDWDFISNKDDLNFIKDGDIPLKNKISISFDKNYNILIQSFVLFLIGVILIMIAAYIEVYITKDLAIYLIQTFHIK